VDLLIATGLIVLLLALLASGLWIALAMLGVAVIAMQFLTQRPVGDSMMLTMWGSTSSWTLTALPLFLWMGEILFRSRISSDMFRGLAPWLNWLPGRLLHVNVIGCAIFAAVCGSSTATSLTVGKISMPELKKRGYPDDIAIGTLCGSGTLGLLIPPSIIMIVYGVAAEVSIAKLFIAGVLPGMFLAALFSGYIIAWSIFNKEKIPPPDPAMTLGAKLHASRNVIPVLLLIVVVLGSIYLGVATATEAAALGVAGALLLARIEGSLTWKVFKEGLVSGCRVYCMIGLILAAAAFLTLAMGFIGLPRRLAELIGTLDLSPFGLIVCLTAFYILLGCFLDGISMVVLTMAVMLPTVQAAGIDLLWFGVFIVLVVEMAQLTPPVGFNLFVLQSLSGRDIVYIARVSLPLFLLMVVAVLCIYYFPQIVLWLPANM
jgi:tripartite ATP-independent transporter DctM subunit